MKLPGRRDYPKSVVVQGHDCQIKWKRKIEGGGIEGLFDPNTFDISIRIGQTPRQTFYTLVHEVIHALEESMGFEITEEIVSKLEKGFGDFILDNLPFIMKG